MSRILVVGAGVAGILAADTLARAGHRVTVVDKGRGVGGRMATRRIGEARVDHGAQFFTVRHDRFRAVVERWTADGVAHEWCRGFAGRPDGHPRYAGTGGMSSPAKSLAAGLADIRLATRLTSRQVGADGTWTATTDGGELIPDEPPRQRSDESPLETDAVVCTPPAPQTLDLLRAVDAVAPSALARLQAIRFDPTLALLVVPDGLTAVPEPGGVQLGDDPVWSWVGDNLAKGASTVPALTLHARPEVSRARLEDDRTATLDALAPLAAPWTAGEARSTQLHVWRYAAPTALDDERCLVAVDGPHPLVCAGDAFGEARVEGAALSGLAAADAVLARLG